MVIRHEIQCDVINVVDAAKVNSPDGNIFTCCWYSTLASINASVWLESIYCISCVIFNISFIKRETLICWFVKGNIVCRKKKKEKLIFNHVIEMFNKCFMYIIMTLKKSWFLYKLPFFFKNLFLLSNVRTDSAWQEKLTNFCNLL